MSTVDFSALYVAITSTVWHLIIGERQQPELKVAIHTADMQLVCNETLLSWVTFHEKSPQCSKGFYCMEVTLYLK